MDKVWKIPVNYERDINDVMREIKDKMEKCMCCEDCQGCCSDNI